MTNAAQYGRGTNVAGILYPIIRRAWEESQEHLVVGLCGPQGSGKSTAAAGLQKRLMQDGLHCAILALDDLYFGRAERATLATTVHPLLATRGVPGTHDIDLGLRLLDALGTDAKVQIPSFDKLADDRRPKEMWRHFEGPADVILFEGWCVGARPGQPGELETPINALERDEDDDGVWRRFVDTSLHGYQPLFDRVGFSILLQPPAFEIVTRWRHEQERELGQATDTAKIMNAAAVHRFVQHYERISRRIIAADDDRDVVINLDADRRPIACLERARPSCSERIV